MVTVPSALLVIVVSVGAGVTVYCLASAVTEAIVDWYLRRKGWTRAELEEERQAILRQADEILEQTPRRGTGVPAPLMRARVWLDSRRRDRRR